MSVSWRCPSVWTGPGGPGGPDSSLSCIIDCPFCTIYYDTMVEEMCTLSESVTVIMMLVVMGILSATYEEKVKKAKKGS